MRAQEPITKDAIPALLKELGPPWGSQLELDLIPWEPTDGGHRADYRVRLRWADQSYEFVMKDYESYCKEVAPARTFGFVRDLRMMAELGLASGGRLDNFILVGEDNIINTELRFPDEFARHKILDIVGDLYLLGFPIRGRVEAHLTGHRANIALLRKIGS